MNIFIQLISLVGRLFANGLWDWGLIPGWVILKTQKIVCDTALLNPQHYKVWIKDKEEQGEELNPPLHISVVAIEKGAFRLPLTIVANFAFFIHTKSHREMKTMEDMLYNVYFYLLYFFNCLTNSPPIAIYCYIEDLSA